MSIVFMIYSVMYLWGLHQLHKCSPITPSQLFSGTHLSSSGSHDGVQEQYSQVCQPHSQFKFHKLSCIFSFTLPIGQYNIATF